VLTKIDKLLTPSCNESGVGDGVGPGGSGLSLLSSMYAFIEYKD
jgi:hypothetical protein